AADVFGAGDVPYHRAAADKQYGGLCYVGDAGEWGVAVSAVCVHGESEPEHGGISGERADGRGGAEQHGESAPDVLLQQRRPDHHYLRFHGDQRLEGDACRGHTWNGNDRVPGEQQRGDGGTRAAYGGDSRGNDGFGG